VTEAAQSSEWRRAVIGLLLGVAFGALVGLLSKPRANRIG